MEVSWWSSGSFRGDPVDCFMLSSGSFTCKHKHGLHVLPVSARLHSRCSDFLLTSKDSFVRFAYAAGLTVVVLIVRLLIVCRRSVNCCRSAHVQLRCFKKIVFYSHFHGDEAQGVFKSVMISDLEQCRLINRHPEHNKSFLFSCEKCCVNGAEMSDDVGPNEEFSVLIFLWSVQLWLHSCWVCCLKLSSALRMSIKGWMSLRQPQ